MAVSETNSSHTDWMQFYQRNLSYQATGGGGGVVLGGAPPMTESTVVTTTTTSPTPAGPGGGDHRAQQAPEGRVGKARKRSRASRKAPTTVLNTDTTNFRAMVQQFTGVPSRPFQEGYPYMAAAGSNPAALSFGLARGGATAQLHQQAPGVFPFGVQQPQYQQYAQFQQQQHERPLFALGGGGDGSGASGGGEPYNLRGVGSYMRRDGMEASEGLLLETISSSQMMPRPAASTGSSTADGFLL